MAKGFTGNTLLKCSASKKAEDNDSKETVIIRVFGDFGDRDSEVTIMRKLSEKGIIPPLYCR